MKSSDRLESLDVFRGITMAAMVVVNNPGDWGHTYAPLLHAAWHGWTPTDLVFPFFLFIVGVAMTLSRATMGSPWKILRRGAVIFALGMLLAGWPRFPLDTWRIPGVLQRIALCYLAAAGLFRLTAPSGGEGDARLKTHGVRLLGWTAALTLGYWAVLMLVPPPGGAAGDLRPGQDIGAYLDRSVFGAHLWSQSKTWDPEGLLSTVPAVATTLIGLVTGLLLASSRSGAQKTGLMVAAGAVCVAVGQAWALVFPINKALWTSSYVWLTGGAALWFLAACYWLVDVWGWRRWSRPLVVLGRNAMALFVGSGLLAKWMIVTKVQRSGGGFASIRTVVYETMFVPVGDPYQSSLLFALANLAVMWFVLYVMYRRRWFLTV